MRLPGAPMAATTWSRAACEAFLLGFLEACAGTLGAAAAELPPALFNRSVTLSWNEYRVQRCDSGEISRGNTNSVLQVYISGEGRLFSRLKRRGGGGQGNSTDSDPEGGENRAGQGASRLNLHFENQQLLIDTPMRSGARRVQVDFDTGFATCRLDVRFGKEGGRDLYHRTMDGRMCTIISTDVSGQSCAIRNGNPFAER
jgi:hypothetical protein